MDLEEMRNTIGRLDTELLKLLNRRMEYALRTRNLKPQIADPVREQQVLAAIRKRTTDVIGAEFAERLFKEIIEESKRLQQEIQTLVGFQGEHGAHSEMAVRLLNPAWVPIPCKEFQEVFEGVANRELDFGAVPVENSLEGAVTQVNDLLVETELTVVAERRVPIHQCLLTLPETDYRDIRVVYSHPHALAQCRGFLSRNKLEARPYYDTSGAAMMLANERPRAAAAIASALCGEIYGLEVIKENIEDHESNSTRFVVLSREATQQDGDKCSIIFATAHRSGALVSVLSMFANAGINLTRIESRPLRRDPGTFAFLLDFLASNQDPRVQDILAKIQEQTSWSKFLGCYKQASS